MSDQYQEHRKELKKRMKKLVLRARKRDFRLGRGGANSYSLELPVSVEIAGVVYSVEGVVSSGRGWKFQLGKHDGLIHRVCHAPKARCGSAFTSGEKILYRWS